MDVIILCGRLALDVEQRRQPLVSVNETIPTAITRRLEVSDSASGGRVKIAYSKKITEIASSSRIFS